MIYRRQKRWFRLLYESGFSTRPHRLKKKVRCDPQTYLPVEWLLKVKAFVLLSRATRRVSSSRRGPIENYVGRYFVDPLSFNFKQYNIVHFDLVLWNALILKRKFSRYIYYTSRRTILSGEKWKLLLLHENNEQLY